MNSRQYEIPERTLKDKFKIVVCSKGIPSTVETRRGNSHGLVRKKHLMQMQRVECIKCAIRQNYSAKVVVTVVTSIARPGPNGAKITYRRQ